MLINPNSFWQYSYSNFLDNRVRGDLAEFIVASALDITGETPFTSWESYDLEYKGIKIEIKTSAYIQTWKQDKPTTPKFGISLKQGWVGETNEWDGKKIRHADVYIFCLLAHQDEKTIEPLETDQWKFYVVKTLELNKKLGKQKSLGLSTMLSIEHKDCKYSELKEIIDYLFNL